MKVIAEIASTTMLTDAEGGVRVGGDPVGGDQAGHAPAEPGDARAHDPAQPRSDQHEAEHVEAPSMAGVNSPARSGAQRRPPAAPRRACRRRRRRAAAPSRCAGAGRRPSRLIASGLADRQDSDVTGTSITSTGVPARISPSSHGLDSHVLGPEASTLEHHALRRDPPAHLVGGPGQGRARRGGEAGLHAGDHRGLQPGRADQPDRGQPLLALGPADPRDHEDHDDHRAEQQHRAEEAATPAGRT